MHFLFFFFCNRGPRYVFSFWHFPLLAYKYFCLAFFVQLFLNLALLVFSLYSNIVTFVTDTFSCFVRIGMIVSYFSQWTYNLKNVVWIFLTETLYQRAFLTFFGKWNRSLSQRCKTVLKPTIWRLLLIDSCQDKYKIRLFKSMYLNLYIQTGFDST